MVRSMKFKPGFRISVIDIIFSLVVLAIGWLLIGVNEDVALLVVMAGLQFFLFCNVFRISRMPELIWASLYVAISAIMILLGIIGLVIISVTSVIGLVVILNEMRRPSYHGVGWSKINPELEKRFNKNLAK
jgi:hypothetical protein